MRWQWCTAKNFGLIAFGFALLSCSAVPAKAQQKARMSNMELLGYNDLQGRNAYIPAIQKQGDRWIAYIAHHGDEPMRMNPSDWQGGAERYIDRRRHRSPDIRSISFTFRDSREVVAPRLSAPAAASDLPHGEKGKYYLLRAFGGASWEMWDVTNPSGPTRMNVMHRRTQKHPQYLVGVRQRNCVSHWGPARLA